MDLRVEEHLGVGDAVGRRLGKIGVRKGLKVGGGEEDGEADVVVVEELAG
jgi:hypothetical protein